MNSIDKLIETLTRSKKMVLSTEGPNLIVAGAGSGKTRVLTTRLIHIINQKLFPIKFYVTFSQTKAAKEMQNRVMQHIKGSFQCSSIQGTFQLNKCKDFTAAWKR